MPFKVGQSQIKYSNDPEYLLYQALLFLRKTYFFIINMPWTKIIFWAQIIAAVLILIFIAGIVYNLIGTSRSKNKEEEL